ncbi:MAG: beta-galactosidase [Opitutaceae bacterium]|jgi:beta-glucuronidase|nr:beta-galactosidase [Opitutaceae bacterium]
MNRTKTPVMLLSLTLAMLALLALPTLHAQTEKTSLDGEWQFGLDPVGAGETQAWFKPGFVNAHWDKVSVPHCFSVDPRYHYYTGNAWYFRTFTAEPAAQGTRVFVHFDAVFYHATVWLNGKLLGEHEGGYTPFEFDATGLLSDKADRKNALVVRVNNAWSTGTIPGAKTRVSYQNLNYGQLFPWINYGGITRPVSLLVRPEFHIAKTKVEATPDLAAGTATLLVRVFVRNRSADATWTSRDIGLNLYRDGKRVPVDAKISGGPVGPRGTGVFRIEAMLPGESVALWGFDHPVMYDAEVRAGKDVARVPFGIRSIEVRGTKLLLNGETISLGGCNRPLDYPGYGSMDPTKVLEQDMRLIKSGGMELSRISHYPVSTELLDQADRLGMLIIGEAGNWQMTPEQMADPVMREKFQAQMREMVERDWNHPSVIAWSLGNEYQSQTDAGQAWTRDMYAFAKALDASRLVTFASNIVTRPNIKKPEDEASQYVDFISANIYGDHLQRLQRIHALYPEKPVYVSEFGLRADKVKNEQERVNYVRRAMADFRKCDFLIGASVWTFNDYQSSFPGTNANGYRPFGLVEPDRTPRAMYYAWQKEFAPAVVTVKKTDSGAFEASVTARTDFPSYTMRNYKLKAGGRVFDIPRLFPGETETFTVTPGTGAAKIAVELEKPGGFTILKTEYPVR